MTLLSRPAPGRSYRYLLLAMIALVPVIIYFNFLPWKSVTIYGDDLFIYKTHENLRGFFKKISMPVLFDKFRPVHGLAMHFLLDVFHKHTGGYYFFNIAIQTVNTLLFAITANLFLRSPWLSVIAGLTTGLSRFAFFNITQLLNGGALEGMAMTFFLASLFFMVRALLLAREPAGRQDKDLLMCLLFANLCMYTHERYIVLFPFVLLLVLLYPGLRYLNRRRKLYLCSVAVLSVTLNIFLKKELYHMAFFVGTGGTNITFSLASATTFFTQAVFSILQINTGPTFLVGIEFVSLPFINQLPVFVFLTGLVLVFIAYLLSVIQAFRAKQRGQLNHFRIFGSLIILTGLFLVPAIVTIRLEPRWLQASYSIVVLLCILMLVNLGFKNNMVKTAVQLLFFLLLILIDCTYLRLGAESIYMRNAEAVAGNFEKAIHNGTIRPGTTKLYIWEKQRNKNAENSVRWELADGYFFHFYQQHSKQLAFLDSVYPGSQAASAHILKTFNQKTDQLVYYNNDVIDITQKYLRDSLTDFSGGAGTAGDDHPPVTFRDAVSITAANADSFSVAGIYENENGIRWTNGNAVIDFRGGYLVTDSIYVTLDTYLPEICKNIKPVVAFVSHHKPFNPVYTKRVMDVFVYVFYFPAETLVQQVQVVSGKIDAGPQDKRILSFPFKSLVLRK